MNAWCKDCMRDYTARRLKRIRLDRRLAEALASEPSEPPCPISGEPCLVGLDGLCPCERVIGGP